MISKLQKEFDLDILIGISDAPKYLNAKELFIMNFASSYNDRFNNYYKYRVRKARKETTAGS